MYNEGDYLEISWEDGVTYTVTGKVTYIDNKPMLGYIALDSKHYTVGKHIPKVQEPMLPDAIVGGVGGARFIRLRTTPYRGSDKYWYGINGGKCYTWDQLQDYEPYIIFEGA